MRIVCFGDSNTWGYEAGTGHRLDDRYTRLLAAAMPEHEIIEEGLNGRTTCYDDPFEEGRNGCKAIVPLLRTHTPIDLFVIMLGSNDAKRIFSTNEYSLERGLRTLLQQAKGQGIFKNGYHAPKFLLIQPPRMHPDFIKNRETYMNFGQAGFDMLEQGGWHVKKVAEEMKTDYLLTDDICMAGPLDGLHMDLDNHRKLAEALIKKIRGME
ncbi:MAG: hypothetical protein J6D36_04680 [Erysipelotrichaceae bacterium]|nr:hypothetical protein [Erysipelotrichaceae bacterium]